MVHVVFLVLNLANGTIIGQLSSEETVSKARCELALSNDRIELAKEYSAKLGFEVLLVGACIPAGEPA